MDTPLNQDIKDLVNDLNRGLVPTDQLFDSTLDRLQDFECWSLYFRLLELQIDNPKKRQISHYIRTARAYVAHLEDVPRAAKICVKLIKDLRMSYRDFRDQALSQIIVEQEFDSEAAILQAILPRLKSKEDTISCLERLCLIYEKKKYDENLLNRCYQRLIELDHNNLKALRYFKVIYTQNNQWDKVVSVLQSLFQSARHVNDRFRSAQELAAVYLYQLDQPQNSIDIIEKHCVGSPLNTFTIHYEAYFRMQNWDGCLKVLGSYLSKVDDSLSKAIIYCKMGELLEQSRKPLEAEASYLKSLELAPQMLEPIENLIDIGLEKSNWDKVLKFLHMLQTLVSDTHLQEKIREAIARLMEAVEGEKQLAARN